MPFALKEAGLVMGTILIVVMGIITGASFSHKPTQTAESEREREGERGRERERNYSQAHYSVREVERKKAAN